jgi:hypothetical protein
MIRVNDDTFANMVADDVKNKVTPQQRAILMEQKNWDKWKRALVVLVDNLDEQISDAKCAMEVDANRYKAALGSDGKKLIHESNQAYQRRIVKIERFKDHVQRRLDQVVSMIETGEPINSNPWEMVDFYRKVISTHRSLMNKYNLEPTAIDNALWESLENKWTFDSITADSIQ